MGKHDDIIYKNRPEFNRFPHMSIEDRAAQFSSFAALVGYGEMVQETGESWNEDFEEGTYAVFDESGELK